MRKEKRAQEEMVGFALIVIIVAVILLVFLAFHLRNRNKEAVESYEVESFIQSALQYTTECISGADYLEIQELIAECHGNYLCYDGRASCEVLELTLEEILNTSWKTGENRPVKGYEMKISSGESEILNLNQGNITRSSRGAFQDFSKRGSEYIIVLNVYS